MMVRFLVLGLLTAIVLAMTVSPSQIAAQPSIEPRHTPPGGFVGPRLPDLVVTTFSLLTTSPASARDHFEVPISVDVKNQGTAEAGIFKVSIEYIIAGAGFPVSYTASFTVKDQGDCQFPYTRAPLPAGATVNFTGGVRFPLSLRGWTVTLKALADSCRGDPFMPDYCRVRESSEGNNTSTPVSVSLP